MPAVLRASPAPQERPASSKAKSWEPRAPKPGPATPIASASPRKAKPVLVAATTARTAAAEGAFLVTSRSFSPFFARFFASHRTANTRAHRPGCRTETQRDRGGAARVRRADPAFVSPAFFPEPCVSRRTNDELIFVSQRDECIDGASSVSTQSRIPCINSAPSVFLGHKNHTNTRD